jgi:hypothetical protein
MMADLTQQKPWQVAIRLLPLRHSHGPLSVIFSSIIKNQESLSWKRSAGKNRCEVLPTGVALILS